GDLGVVLRFGFAVGFLVFLFFVPVAVLVLFLIGLLFVVFLIVFFFLGILFLRVFVFPGLRFVVISRRERRRHIATQRHCREPHRVRVNPGVIEIAVNRAEAAARAEIEIFTVRIEHRQIVIVKTARHLMARIVLEIIKHNRRVPR